MSKKYEEATIDGIVFGTTQFGAMRALELMGRLVQTIGPALGVISTANPDTPIEQLAPILAGALSNLKPQELGSLAMTILAGTQATITINGELRRVDILSENDFNKVFDGRLMTMFKAIMHALKVNYSDFGLGSAPTPAPVSAPTAAAKE